MTSTPWRLKELTPREVRARIERRSALIVPVGSTEQHGGHLPLGCDTIIVERLADDLSARFGVLRSPAIEFAVKSTFDRGPAGASLRRKTLHRVMNELLDSWERDDGVEHFVILTAEGHEAHQEALSTVYVTRARVQTVDVFAMDFGTLLEQPAGPVHGGELDTSLLLHIAPELVRMSDARDTDLTPEALARVPRGSTRPIRRLGREHSLGFPSIASATKGAALYTFILDRISKQCFDQDD